MTLLRGRYILKGKTITGKTIYIKDQEEKMPLKQRGIQNHTQKKVPLIVLPKIVLPFYTPL
jgi:hypothetical protein